MNRAYISTADFRAPYDAATLQGLGEYGERIGHFPKMGRSYWTVANFRAPYDDGYFQDNDLFGVPPDDVVMPASVDRYLSGGKAPSTLGRDIAVPFNQIPRWVYIVGGLAGMWVVYQRVQKAKRKKKGG